MLELLIDKMKSFGIKDIIINVHHFPGQIISFLKENYKFNINIQLSHEINLLDTGGGIKKAQWFFNDNQPFLVHNVDIMSNVSFQAMLTQHSNSDCLATLAVSKRSGDRQLLFDDKTNLAGWTNSKTKEKILVPKAKEPFKELAFSGIQFISPTYFDLVEENLPFSIIDAYLKNAAKYKVKSFEHDASQWYDLGKHEGIKQYIKAKYH